MMNGISALSIFMNLRLTNFETNVDTMAKIKFYTSGTQFFNGGQIEQFKL